MALAMRGCIALSFCADSVHAPKPNTAPSTTPEMNFFMSVCLSSLVLGNLRSVHLSRGIKKQPCEILMIWRTSRRRQENERGPMGAAPQGPSRVLGLFGSLAPAHLLDLVEVDFASLVHGLVR